MKKYSITEYCKNIDGRIYHRVATYADGNPLYFSTFAAANEHGDSVKNDGHNGVIDFSVQTVNDEI